MRVVFLGHSGFLVELPSVTLLFDWTEGELPALRPGAPLLVFASHAHADHFKPEIFRLEAAAFLLGKDLKLTERNRERWSLDKAAAERCLRLGDGQIAEPLPGVLVEALPSTDEGAAFLVTLPGGDTVFHAGDLNWWHWEGEDPAWNSNMAANFKRYTAPLAGRTIDLAMLPLDPRLGEDGFRGPAHFLETANITRFLPMHQWGEFAFTIKFLERYPQYTDQTLNITAPGQVFCLPQGDFPLL